jgi:type III pantothenate kinase
MIFVMDVGNTNTKCGLFKDDQLIHSWRIATNPDQTSDELGISLTSFFKYLKLDTKDVKGMMISSVIPSFNYTLTHMSEMYFKIHPCCVGPGIRTGINILYENPKELGADRIVNAAAAYELYGGPSITVDFGTATSYGAISEKGEFLGGVICPGIKISAEALTQNAANLPHVDLKRTVNIINRSTVTCMQSGIFYGYAGQVDYIIRKMKREMSGKPLVIATGGLSDLIAKETKVIDKIDTLLTLQGLNIIYKKNFG